MAAKDDAIGLDPDIDLELESFLSDKASSSAAPSAPSSSLGTLGDKLQANLSTAASSFASHVDLDDGRSDKALEPTTYANIAAMAVGRSYHETAASHPGESSGGASSQRASLPASLPGSDLLTPEQSRFLNSARPWKDFLLPVSIPSASSIIPRFSANLFHFQTNYALVLLVCLAIEILLHPSTLVSILFTMAVWVIFMKKNNDPEWNPKIGTFQPGPLQRLLVLGAVTAVVLLSTAGSTISSTALLYLGFVVVHGLLHDPVAVANVGFDGTPVPL